MGRIFLCAIAAMASPILSGSIGRTLGVEQRWLDAHNRERSTIGSPALGWDEELAAEARKWAQTLARTGRFEHAHQDPSDPEYQGENIWGGTRGAWSPEEMVGYWVAEKRDYKPGIFPAVSRSGNLAQVGHYTQVIWRNTRKVGCALARGAREDILVCRYSEGGNVIGERPI